MSTDRDVTRIVRSWLEEGATALPDRVLDKVLDQLPATPQRRAWWPAWRLYDMNNNMKAAIVAAVAVVVVVVAGINLLPAGGAGGRGATPTPSASPIASPSASPSASQSLVPSGRLCTATNCTAGALGPGTYYFEEGLFAPGRFTFTVPGVGWATDGGFVNKNHDRANEVLLSTWIPSHVYADSCHWRGTLIDVRGSVDKLARALVNQKGRQISGPTDVMLGGFPAKRIEMSIPAGLDPATCDDKFLRSWPDPGPDENGGLAAGRGSIDVMYIVDVDGRPLAVVAAHSAISSAEDQAELEAMVSSIRIDHPTATASPAASP